MTDVTDGKGQTVNLLQAADWSAYEGTDKNFSGHDDDEVFQETYGINYTVPAGKTLYIVGMSFSIVASNAADGDKNQIGLLRLDLNVALNTLVSFGGNGGGVQVFSKPFKFTAGQIMKLVSQSLANHDVDIQLNCWGYEL